MRLVPNFYPDNTERRVEAQETAQPWKLIVLFLVLITLPLIVQAKKPADDPVPNPDPGQKAFSAVPNLSFPMIATDIIDVFYQKVWVEDDVLGEEGYGEIADNEWVVGYDSDGDGVIDNVLGDGIPVPIAVIESITDAYTGDYPGNEGFYYQTYVVVDGMTVDELTQTVEQLPDGSYDCTDVLGADGVVDKTCPIDMVEYFESMEPWYDQPVQMDNMTTETVTSFDGTLTATIPVAANPNNIWNIEYLDGTDIGGENSWQAEWFWTGDPEAPILPDGKIYVDFIDWGNPLENTVAPIVGQRFPVEMAIFEQVASTVTDDIWGTPMIGYNVACIELPSTRDEVFGTSTLDTGEFSKEIAYATVLTNQFFAEVWDPDGGITSISLAPGIGPSGKINYASAGGGWIPEMAGWHRIWVHFNDPLITLEGAIVNNDEHYVLSSGWLAEVLNRNKEDLVGIVGDSTFVDVYVYPPSGGKKPKKK